MSIYDACIAADALEIFEDDLGFAEKHNVNGEEMTAIVHNSQISGKSTLVDLAAVGSDVALLVRTVEYGEELPNPGAIFFLDDTEYRVQSASIIGGAVTKISLNRVDV